MKVAMLAAGVGRRLGMAEDAPPKALLRFNGESLLKRHLDILAHFGLLDLTLVVGHQASAIEVELGAIGARARVRTRFNPDYRESSLLSLWTLFDVLAAGRPVLYMDADVLYDWRLLERLLKSPHANCILIDRDFEPDADLVDVRIRDGRIVAFDKGVPPADDDIRGEWIGFARFDAESAAALARAIEGYVQSGRADVIYEKAMRDVILAADAFGFEDVTGLPWIEIDFPEDLQRAHGEILPRLIGLPPTPR
ncbi:MAG: NTP transferase domain-containing protein [Geminicoccaceae bacterium]